MTPLVESIIANHAGQDSVTPGQLLTDVRVDRVYLQDGNTPTIRKLFADFGFTQVFDPERIAVFFDHAVLSPESEMSNRLREAEEFARSLSLNIFAAGSGISHVVALEEGWFEPGKIVVGADSHTCTGGVAQCLSLGMGASDIVAAMVTGTVWLRVPETVWIDLKGSPLPIARSKDVMLYILARFGQSPFLYKSVEWSGDWLTSLSLDAATTIANLAVELGCKCCFLPANTQRWPKAREIQMPAETDPRRLMIDITGLPPFIACPDAPTSGVPLDEQADQEIDYVFIGTCANGRLDDLQEVSSILARSRIHPRVHCVVTPGSRSVYLAALRMGLIESMVMAGAIITPPGCGACVGTQGSIPADGARVLSTANRNFRGRMGNPRAKIWLCSPSVAAYGAILGRIPRTSELQ